MACEYYINGKKICVGDCTEAIIDELVYNIPLADINKAIPDIQSIPNMPFKKTDQWAGLAMRRMIKYAIDNGFDRIAWTTGEQQADRYDLSKQIEKIKYSKEVSADLYSIYIEDKNGNKILERGGVDADYIEQNVGKELAQKIVNGEGEETGGGFGREKQLSGLDLKVGGEGMAAFYDKILPSIANKIGKRYGAKVESTPILLNPDNGDVFWDPGDEVYRRKDNEDIVINEADIQHSLPITPELLTAFQDQVPMFKKKGDKVQDVENAGDYVTGLRKKERIVRATAEQLSQQLGTPIEVVMSAEDLPAPLRKMVLKDQKNGIRVPALYDGEKAYILYSDVKEEKDVVRTVLHEVVAHHGLRNMFGNEFDKVLEDVYKSMSPADISTIQRLYNTTDNLLTAEEYIAHIAENGTDMTRWQQFVAAVRKLFRKYFGINYSENDIKDMLRKSQEKLQEEAKPKAKDFASASEYFDALEAYHGTGANVKKFTTKKTGTGQGNLYYGWGLYFSSNQAIGKEYAKAMGKYDSYYQKAEKSIDSKSAKWIDLALVKTGFNNEAVIPFLQEKIDRYQSNPTLTNRFKRAMEYVQNNPLPENRYVYRVMLRNKPQGKMSFLKWDGQVSNIQAKSIYEQMVKEGVGNASLELALLDASGQKVYEMLSNTLKSDKAASAFLQRAGVDGIQYPAGKMSKEAGQTGTNYVVFDENNVVVTDRVRFKINNDVTKTAEFKKWFKNSKVVDEDGEPLIVYRGEHGKTYSGNDDIQSDLGSISFARDPETANLYATEPNNSFQTAVNPRVMPVYLSIQNPFMNDDIDPFLDLHYLIDAIGIEETKERVLKNKSILYSIEGTNMWEERSSESGMDIEEYIKNADKEQLGELYGNAYQFFDDAIIVDLLKEKGFDGAIHAGSGENSDDVEYKVFDKSQVRSALTDTRFKKTTPSGPPINMITPKTDAPINVIQQGDKLERARVVAQDKMLSVRKLQNQVIGRGGKVDDYSNPYMQENLSHGVVKESIGDYDTKYVSPLVNTIVKIQNKSGLTYEDLNDYMMAKHAPERNEYMFEKSQGKIKDGSGIPTEDVFNDDGTIKEKGAKTLIREYEDKIPDELIEELWENVRKATEYSLKRNMNDGFLSKEGYDKITKLYNYYVPLRGWAKSPTDDLFEYMNEDVGKSVNPNRRAKGRTTRAGDPLQYIVNMAHTSIVMGEKNIVKQHMSRLIRNNKQMDDLFRFKKTYWVWDGTFDNETGKKNYTEVIDRPAKELFDKGMVESRFNLDHMSRKPRSIAGEHESEVWINGEKYVMILPADVSNAINKTPSKWDQASFVTQKVGVGKLTRWLSSNFTSKNPAFIPINQIRDLQYALFSHMIRGNKKDAAKFIKNLKGARGAIIRDLKGTSDMSNPNDQMYRDFKLNGGETGWIHMKDVDQLEKDLKKAIARASRGGGAKVAQDIYLGAGKLMEHWSIRSENLSRFATYMVAKQNGKSDKQAAQEAKDVTVNFNRKGRMSSLMGSLYAFFNASLQGGHNIVKMGKDKPAAFFGVGAGFMAMGFMTALFNSLWGGDDDDDTMNDYKELGDYTKYNNMVIPAFWKKDDKFITVPLPHGFRWFNALGVLAYQSFVDDEKDTGQFIAEGIEQMFSAVSPMNPVDLLKEEENILGKLRPLSPSGLTPIIDIATNRDFAGNKIRREPFTSALQGRTADAALGMPYVNKFVKSFTDFMFTLGGGDPQVGNKYYEDDNGNIQKVSEFFDVNPSNIEHTFEYYLGGRFTFWNNVVKTALQIQEGAGEVIGGDEEFRNILKEVNSNNIPIVRRLYSQPWGNSIYTRYYDIVNDFKNYEQFKRDYAKGHDVEYIEDTYNPYYSYVKDELKYLKKDLEYIDEDIETITDSNQVIELKDEQERLIRIFIENVSNYQKQWKQEK